MTFFYDVLDRHNLPVRWFDAPHATREQAIAGLTDVVLADGEVARVFPADMSAPFAQIRAGVLEVLT